VVCTTRSSSFTWAASNSPRRTGNTQSETNKTRTRTRYTSGEPRAMPVTGRCTACLCLCRVIQCRVQCTGACACKCSLTCVVGVSAFGVRSGNHVVERGV
jgi:hypothetical protein